MTTILTRPAATPLWSATAGRWTGHLIFFPDGYKVTAHMGTATDALSGEDGTFSPAVWTQLNFSGVDILQAASVFFSTDPLDGYPVDFTVEVIQGGVTYYTKTYTDHTATSVVMDGFTVYNPDAIRVTCTKWSRPGRRMRLVEILPGHLRGVEQRNAGGV